MPRVSQEESFPKKVLLDVLHATGMILTCACHLPSAAYLDRKTYEAICKAKERRAVWQALKRLEKQKLLSVEKKGERVVIEFTAKGKTAILQENIRQIKELLPRGEYCVVCFDVPEQIRHVRWFLRDFLKEAGFEKVQKSVWRSPYNVIEPFYELVQTMDIEDWIQIFQAKQVTQLSKNKPWISLKKQRALLKQRRKTQ